MAYVPGVLGQVKICILIPAHNEAQAIGTLVEKLKRLALNVVVIDDGSEDNTGEIAAAKGAHVITVKERGGKGNAIQKGFAYVVGQGYDALIMMDGDGQHAVEDVPKFIERFQATNASIINGNRMGSHGDMPFVRVVTNKFMSWMISSVCRQRIADSQCGFRLISCAVLRAIKLTSTNFEIESEILIKASRQGFKIDSVPVQTIYEDEQSKIRPVKDTIRFFKYLARELWHREP
jgi:glycosyltransferase involved in cell wall biosynthesis